MIEFSPCKINLGLHIVSKRADGFHQLSTLMYPIVGRPDIIELQKTDHDKFSSSGIIIDCPDTDNLCIKTLHLLRTHYHIPPIHIHLHKQTPFGAGLGGGSANATTVLKLCNKEFALGLNNEKLENLAAQMGSDTPFFVKNIPQIATGRGEILSPIEIDLSLYYICIVKPPIAISTREAYAGVIPRKPKVSIENIVREPVDKWHNLLQNDFEKSLFPKYPLLREIKEELYSNGAIYASLSGSGSALYGIFKTPPPKTLSHFWHTEMPK